MALVGQVGDYYAKFTIEQENIMNTFAKMFSGTLGIVLGISFIFIVLCVYCLIFAAVGQTIDLGILTPAP